MTIQPTGALQVSVQKAKGRPITVREETHLAAGLFPLTSNALKSIQSQLNPDTIFIPQLTPLGGIDTDDNHTLPAAVDHIQDIISTTFPEIDTTIITQYMTQFRSLNSDQQRKLRNMFLQIQQVISRTHDENIKTIATSVITDPVCFTGQKNTLMQVLALSLIHI